MLKLLNGFVIKRLVAAATGGLALIFGQDYASHLAELLMDPEFIQKAFDFIGTGLLLYAGLAGKDVSVEKASLDKAEEVILDYLPPKTELDPYPGYDYDPLRGWVETDG